MIYVLISIMFIGVLQTCLMFCMVYQVDVLRGQIAELLAWYAGEEVSDYSDEPSLETASIEEVEHSEYAEERERAFNERIARIKEELDAEQVQRTGTTAEVLHPLIENLPHDTIPNHETNPPYEEYVR